MLIAIGMLQGGEPNNKSTVTIKNKILGLV